MTAIDRFLRYVTYDTQSDEHSDAIPSTAKQKVLGAALAEELAQMGPVSYTHLTLPTNSLV